MPTLTLDQDIETTRVPELPTLAAYGPLSTSDKLLAYLVVPDKTVQIDISDIIALTGSGGGGGGGGTSFPLAVLGDKLPYQISAAEAGVDTLNIPDLAGKTFYLERGGFPMLTTEFEILNSGGFKLKNAGDVLAEGERFLLTIYELQGGSSAGSNGSKSLFDGAVSVSTNTTFDVVNHLNKLIQLRGGSTQLQYTLPLVDDIPDNTVIVIEAMINNTVEHKIQTQSGQNIYINNDSLTALYMRAGEVLCLYRADDGYYVINGDFARAYADVARNIQASYKVGLNEVLANGQLLSKTAYRRVVAQVQTFGGAYVSRATYDGDPTSYKGCWVDWDTDNIKVPDLMNQFLRGLKSDTGTDSERTVNKPGGFQANQNKVHSHGLPSDGSGSLNLDTLTASPNSDEGYSEAKRTTDSGGIEARPDNIGVLWTVKI